MYELLKLLSKVIRREYPSESINSFITDQEIDGSFDNERIIKTIPLIEKLTRKKRKLISLRLRILYTRLFDIIKSLRTCKEKSLKNCYTPFCTIKKSIPIVLEKCMCNMLHNKRNELSLSKTN